MLRANGRDGSRIFIMFMGGFPKKKGRTGEVRPK
jgi:hypothetical protein